MKSQADMDIARQFCEHSLINKRNGINNIKDNSMIATEHWGPFI